MATDTCEKELVRTPKTGFALSTCTEVELILGDSKTSLLEELAKIAASQIRFRDVTAIQNAYGNLSRHLTVFAGSGSLNFAASCKTFTVSRSSRICYESRFDRDSLQSRLSVTLPSDFSVLLTEPCNAMLFVFNSRISSNCSDSVQFTMDFEKLPDSSISFRNVIVSSERFFYVLNFVWKHPSCCFCMSITSA